MSGEFFREERTRTVVRHVIQAPAHWVDVQKLLRVVIRDMGYDPVSSNAREPADDEVWFEVGDDDLAICYELTSGISGGLSNSEPLR